MKILIARHGQTNWNLKRRAQGITDIPLNQTGINEAKKLAEALKNIHIDIIIASPLLRAKQTAEIINEGRGLPLIVDESVIERNFGVYEGEDIENPKFPKLRLYHENTPTPNGQTSQEYALQVKSSLKNIIDTFKGKTVLIVAHGVFMRASEWFFNGVPTEDGKEVEIMTKNCELREYEITAPHIQQGIDKINYIC